MQGEFDADAAELAVEARRDRAHLLGIDIGRVGVQFFEHSPNGALDERRHLGIVDIKTVQIAVYLGEFLQLPRSIGVLRREGQHRKGSEEKK